MTDLGSTERRLLRALRAADEPSDDDRARVRARVLLKVAAASGVASALATTAANAPGAAAAAAGTAAGTASVAPGAAATATTLASFAAGSWKIGAAIVTVVGAVSGAAWIATNPKADPPASVAQQHAGQRAQQPAKPAPGEPRPETASADEPESAVASAAHRPRNRTRSADPRASAERKPDELESELLLLENAQQALKQGDSERALAALDQHASEHPGGTLASERAGIRAVALCESGKNAEGKREARRFLSRNPKSPLAVRVRAACLGAKK